MTISELPADLWKIDGFPRRRFRLVGGGAVAAGQQPERCDVNYVGA